MKSLITLLQTCDEILIQFANCIKISSGVQRSGFAVLHLEILVFREAGDHLAALDPAPAVNAAAQGAAPEEVVEVGDQEAHRQAAVEPLQEHAALKSG